MLLIALVVKIVISNNSIRCKCSCWTCNIVTTNIVNLNLWAGVDVRMTTKKTQTDWNICAKYVNHSRFNRQLSWGNLYDHLMSQTFKSISFHFIILDRSGSCLIWIEITNLTNLSLHHKLFPLNQIRNFLMVSICKPHKSLSVQIFKIRVESKDHLLQILNWLLFCFLGVFL